MPARQRRFHGAQAPAAGADKHQSRSPRPPPRGSSLACRRQALAAYARAMVRTDRRRFELRHTFSHPAGPADRVAQALLHRSACERRSTIISGIHPQALQLEAKRNELLAANLANVDTPNYKARDIDFKSALAAASGGRRRHRGSAAATAPLCRRLRPRPERSPGGTLVSADAGGSGIRSDVAQVSRADGARARRQYRR